MIGSGVDIPMISISRFPYPEYHTSDDNPDIISEEIPMTGVSIWLWIMGFAGN